MNGEMRSRSLTAEDETLTFGWRQDLAVIAAAVDQSAPTIEDHHDWMRRRLAGESLTRILLLNDMPAGMFTIVNGDRSDKVSLGYMIAPEFRGMGLAKLARAAAIDFIRQNLPGVRVMESKIRQENWRSLRTALRMGAVQREGIRDGFIYLDTNLA